MTATLACALCVTESAGAGRPPAVTIHEGTALCVEHLIERTRPAPAVEIHTPTDPACLFEKCERIGHLMLAGICLRCGWESGGSGS